MTLFQLGPVNTLMLALMGAEVIKIEPPTGEPGRINTRGREVAGGFGKGQNGTDLSCYFEANNHCKKSLVLDLKLPKAREILYQWADRLSEMSRQTHRVPASTIRHWMDHWKHDLTVRDILKG